MLPRISLCSYNLIRVIRVIRGYLEELVPLHSLAGSGSTAKALGDSLPQRSGTLPDARCPYNDLAQVALIR